MTDSSASGWRAVPTDATDLSSAWKTLIAVAFGAFMTILDVTVVNVAIHSLQQQYSATTSQVQWVISVYALTLGIATPLAAQLGNRFGDKRVYLISLTAFSLASLLCGLAPTLPLLVAARAAQGLAGGFALPLGSARLFVAFPPHKRGVAFGVFGVVLVVAPAIGPLVGGAFIDIGLRSWIFFINVPIGALGVLVGSRFLTADRPSESTTRGGGALSSVALACLGFGGILLGASLPGSPAIRGGHTIALTSLVLGAIALVVLAAIELRRDTPFLNIRLFQIPTYRVGTAINGIGQVAFFGVQFLLPLSVQVVGGASALDAGLTLLPLAISSGVAGVLAGQIRDRFGPRLPLTAGFLLLAAGIVLVRMQLSNPTPWAMVGPLIVAGAGAGTIPPTTQVAALSDVRREDVTSGTSLLQAIQRVCQALCVAILATIITRVVTTSATSPHYPAQYAAGLADAYAVALCVAVGCALLAAFLPGWPGRWNVRGGAPTPTEEKNNAKF